jgi:large subunit ribosomal protein L4e
MEALGASADCDKAKDSKKIRAGKGKMRNRRYVLRRGPLVIYDTKESIDKAFRNLPGVETTSVDRLNLLQLAPGGHMGRFCVWTQVREKNSVCDSPFVVTRHIYIEVRTSVVCIVQ